MRVVVRALLVVSLVGINYAIPTTQEVCRICDECILADGAPETLADGEDLPLADGSASPLADREGMPSSETIACCGYSATGGVPYCSIHEYPQPHCFLWDDGGACDLQ